MARKITSLCVVLACSVLLGSCASEKPKPAINKKASKNAAAKPMTGVKGIPVMTATVSAAPAGHVWIAKADGSQSCGMQSGMTAEQAAQELKKAGIRVLGQRTGQDGQMHMMVCGAATGATVEALIDGEQLDAAEKLGYKSIKAGTP